VHLAKDARLSREDRELIRRITEEMDE
jgi:hypothetical protein